ncbi:MAG: glycosyltransferase [bacterium]|nr:glycosyltransferase [bacterium]
MVNVHLVRRESPTNAKFSILIPTWNNLPYLLLCLKSILKNSFYSHQVLLFVNEGSDGTLEWIKNSDFGYAFASENVGVCKALNSLTSLVQTEYVLYLNDDMYVGKDWDKHLMDAIEAKGDELFYYSGTMVEYENFGNKALLAPYDFGRTYNAFREAAFIELSEASPKKDWFGSCWPPSIVHKKLWDKVGGYDEAYSPGFYSDPDFAMKLWQIGVRDFRGIGKSLVYHFKCKSTGRVVRNNGRKTFAQKWGITSSFFFKEVLKMGKDYDPKVTLKFPGSVKMFLAKLKAWYIDFS